MSFDSYVDLGYVPDDSEFILRYYMEPSPGLSFEKVADMMAGESSVGTWTDISTEDPEQAAKLRPHIYNIDKEKGIFEQVDANQTATQRKHSALAQQVSLGSLDAAVIWDAIARRMSDKLDMTGIPDADRIDSITSATGKVA